MRRALLHPRSLSALLLAASLLAALPVRAQTSKASAAITAVDASAFPAIQAYAQVNDATGQHLANLPAANFTLTEDGQPVNQLLAAEADVGVQVVFALDSGAAFKTRDGNGITRLDYIKQALADFAQTKPWMKTGIDDVTVMAAEGPVVEHSNDSGVVDKAVAGYQSTFAGVADPFTLVNYALDFASDSTRRPGMRRFIVFISGGFQHPDVQGPVTDAAARAAGVGVPITTVFVGPLGAGNTLPAQNLKKLADATGGQALVLETPQSLTPLFQALADQGRQYRLSYRSGLSATGQNKLVLAAKLPDGSALTSNEAAFPLRVEPPHVALGSLPPSVVRVAPSASAAPVSAQPSALDVPVAIDFPDGHARVLKLVQLVVDGQVVATQANTTTVTTLVWPLARYTASAAHHLQARVIDELGLAAESQVTDVSVSLQMPAAPAAVPAPVAALANANWPLLALAASGLVLAVAVGGGAWIILARRRPQAEQTSSRPRARLAKKAVTVVAPGAALTPAELDITLPMAPASRTPANGHATPEAEPPSRRAGHRGLPHVALPAWRWPGRHAPGGARGAAYLQVVEPGGGGAPQPNVELLSATLSLGRDGAVAETVFHDRSVSRLHARIVVAEGNFRIFDAGSTSGTWVNYTAVLPDTGQVLQDGDLINLGRVQLRFRRREGAPDAGQRARVVAVAPAEPPVERPLAERPLVGQPLVGQPLVGQPLVEKPHKDGL
jgi:hypothetical protein